MKKNNLLFLGPRLAISLLPLTSTAQDKAITYMLPGNQVISSEKIDSVAKAWGGNERLAFYHTSDDDKKNIMHLRRVTNEEMKADAESKIRHDKALQDMINKPAPEWTMKDIYGNTLSLKNLKEKVVVLNFWFTSCSPCIREMPHLNELVTQYSGKDVVFIAFAYNDEADIRAFLEKKPFSYVQVPNSKPVNDLYNIDTWPTSFVIDREGKIRLAVNYKENIGQIISDAINAVL